MLFLGADNAQNPIYITTVWGVGISGDSDSVAEAILNLNPVSGKEARTSEKGNPDQGPSQALAH